MIGGLLALLEGSQGLSRCWRTYDLGKSFELTRSWLRWYQIVHITMAIISRIFFFSWSTLIRSLVFEMACCLRSSKPGIASHISSSMAHSQIAWIAVSDSTSHCSHLSSIKEFGKILLGIIRRISFTTYIQYRVRENSN